ncbi:hypothetical protein LZC95_00485 [Pendulispora brunnea]|uniref:Secreted protein n=1 Tax=Pendulispora brunnea TaxID=2905690 RepID=A0ABZ2KG11_9BACT
MHRKRIGSWAVCYVVLILGVVAGCSATEEDAAPLDGTEQSPSSAPSDVSPAAPAKPAACWNECRGPNCEFCRSCCWSDCCGGHCDPWYRCG